MRHPTLDLDAQRMEFSRITGAATRFRSARPGSLAAKLGPFNGAWPRPLALLGHAILGAGMLTATGLFIGSIQPTVSDEPGLTVRATTVPELVAPEAPTLEETRVRTVYIVGSEGEAADLRVSLRDANIVRAHDGLPPLRHAVMVAATPAEAVELVAALADGNRVLGEFGHAERVIDLVTGRGGQKPPD